MAESDVGVRTAEAARTAQRYVRPRDLGEALDLLAGGGWLVLAGGTDVYPATTRQELPGSVLDLTAVEELKGVERSDGGLRIGACATWRAVVAAETPPALDALRHAARLVGGRQIQTTGTVGGNLCNASPAADGVPPLLALDASVELASAENGVRRLPLAEFITGPRRTALGPEELVTAVLIPEDALTGASAFEKLGARAHLVISIAMSAARVTLQDGAIASAALAIGACSPVACRLPDIERQLVGEAADLKALADHVSDEAVAAALSPIDDPRASASYRNQAAGEIVRRALARAIASAKRGTASMTEQDQ